MCEKYFYSFDVRNQLINEWPCQDEGRKIYKGWINEPHEESPLCADGHLIWEKSRKSTNRRIQMLFFES